MEPTWYTLPDFLIEQFPELRDQIEAEYLEYLSVSQNPYPHVFLESVLAPMILGLRTPLSPADRVRAGEILDRILLSPDVDLSEAALTSIVEHLAENDTYREEAWTFLGPKARELVSRLRK